MATLTAVFDHPFFLISLILLAGHIAGKGVNRLGLPKISGYVVVGLLLSPSTTQLVSDNQIDSLFQPVSEFALAFIAYAIGGSLLLGNLKGLGKSIFWITILQGLGAFVGAIGALVLVTGLLPGEIADNLVTLTAVLLVLGGISVATAPAATIAVIHELRARGPMTTTLLGVVALDDVLTIVIFTASVAIATQLQSAGEGSSLILHGVIEVAGAVGVGTLAGFVFSRLLDPSMPSSTILMLTFGAILGVSSVCNTFGFSPILANMILGFIVVNRVRHSDNLFRQLDQLEDTIFCLFFTLAAAHFDFASLSTAALLGSVLLLGRFAGKYGGTWLGGRMSGARPVVSNTLGLTLLPQAGLALGLIFLVQPIFPAPVFDVMLNGMLVSIILNALLAPPIAKFAIEKSGEATT